ncbi:MAG: chromosome segregation protein SMC [Bacillota bacterium]
MFLKRLEVFGFKSFANKVELNLEPGVTAIVGPNGSGKSNIADAIRWALGEQSARQLRGTKMEEVIFAGSSERRPLSMAEVGLTFDNVDGGLGIDYSEVTVNRRVFRSGEGEYLINKNDCRLKDLTDLFADTGVGKEGYSIIGQGQVENVLSGRWEDRRGIFEEAAGIVRYKNRKRDAQKKLDETQQNLVRVADIIAATEAQIEPLEKQYQVAQVYQEYRTRLQALETELYVADASAGRRRLAELKEKSQAHREQADRAVERLAALEAEVDAGRERLTAAEAGVSARQAALAGTNEALVRLEGRRDLAAERLSAIDRERTAKVKEGEVVRGKLAEVSGSLAVEDERQAQLTEELRHGEEELAARSVALEAADRGLGHARETLEKLKGELIEALNEAADERNRTREAEQLKQAAAIRRERLQADLAEADEAQRAADENAVAIRDELDTVRRELTEGQAAVARWRQDGAAAAIGLEAAGKELARRDETSRGLRTRLNLLREMEAGYQGYGEASRRVLLARKENRPAGAGVLGSLAELIEVAPGHERALGAALGELVQAVVVETTADAERLAGETTGQEGRLLVIPLDLVKRLNAAPARREAAAAAARLGAGEGLESWVKARPGGEDLVAWLTDSYVLTSDLSAAWRLVGAFAGRAAVTRSGEVVAPDGVVTAGAGKRSPAGSPLERRRELAELADSLSREELARDKAKTEVDRLAAERGKAEAELAKAQETGHRLEIRLATGDRDRARAEDEAKKAAYQRQLLGLEREKLDRQEADAGRTVEKARRRLEDLKNEETAIRERITGEEKAVAEATATRETLSAQVGDGRVAVATKRQELVGLTSAAAERRHRREELTADLGALEAQGQALTAQAAEVVKAREADEAETALLAARKATEEAELVRAEAERKGIEEGLIAAEKESRSLRRQSDNASARLRAVEVEQARVEAELQRLRDRLSSQYGLDPLGLETEAGEVKPLTDRPAMEAEAEELKARIDALGLVNLAAIDDFQRARERLDFLKTQFADLDQARQQLLKLIDEIDEVMKKRFLEHFLLIKEQFSQVFQRLFGGGRAELILLDEGNLLETGIDILAQPPGKTLQNLSLLSGGEKALTAIALLFAVLEVKPSPFCLLDEIDAALDENNVERFARFLRETARKTQFLIITHQKRTMEVADVLYGVTMEEGGVSKLVSVKLEARAS